LGEEYKSISYSLCSFFHSLVTLSRLRPNIILCTVFRKTLNLRSSLIVSYQVPHPYRTTGKSWFSLQRKCVFWFSLQLLSDTFLILRRTVRNMLTNINRSS
jgi:hypothetical protein